MSGAVYVLDASVFIEAARRYYAFEFAPVFWDSLIRHAQDGRVCSIDRVGDEIERGADDLSDWTREHFAQWFASTRDGATLARYHEVVQWVNEQEFTDAAEDEFFRGADGWLVAFALGGGHVVVTQEAARPEAKARVPIPNVCGAFGVRCMDTFQMLRELGVRWT